MSDEQNRWKKKALEYEVEIDKIKNEFEIFQK